MFSILNNLILPPVDGSSCSKLTMLLVNISLKTLIIEYGI